MATICIIDDDPDIGNLLQEALERENHAVLRAYSGTEALLLLRSTAPDLILLDLMLPGIDGNEVLTHIRDIPVIIISAKGETSDKVTLLKGGACDYVTKPFSIEELMARIEVHLRDRSGAPLSFEDILVDPKAHIFEIAGTPLHLTPTEKILLELLLRQPAQVKTKSVLLDALQTYAPDGTESSLKMHISNLRRKLKAVTGKDHIESIWGIGFRLRSSQSSLKEN